MKVVTVDHIQKRYGDTIAVADVSFDVRQGEIFGLIGPNGAGKTTTMECVEGLRSPDRGAISVLGMHPVRDVYRLQQRIGVQLQEAQLQKRIKVWEAVDLWASLYANPVDGNRLLDQLGMREKRNAWFMTLSGGQKQRLFIALALIHDPELVFLDELTTGLDPQARRAIWDLIRGIRDRGKTVFLTTHLMEEAERLCDRVAVIDHGRIVDVGSPAELIRRHCPERSVIVATTESSAEAHFRTIPDIEAVARSGETVTVRGRGRSRHERDSLHRRAPARGLGLPHRDANSRRRVPAPDRPLDSELTPMLRGLWKLTWLELKIFLREPLGVIGSIAVPVAVFFVLGRAGQRARQAPDVVGPDLPIMAALFIALSSALSLVAILAIYREGGILKRLRATPLRPHTILSAHVIVKLLTTLATVLALMLAGKRYFPEGADIPYVAFALAVLFSTLSSSRLDSSSPASCPPRASRSRSARCCSIRWSCSRDCSFRSRFCRPTRRRCLASCRRVMPCR